MKRIMLIVSLIITLNYAFAQDSTKFSLPKLGFIFSGSALSNSLGDLNNFFKSQEMPFSEYAYNQSAGLTYRAKNESSYSSVQYTMLYSENEDQNLRSRLKGWGLYTTFNYDLLRNRPATLFYPYIGLGFSSYELNLINKNYNETEFSQIIGSLAGEKSFESNDVFFVDLGAGYERRFRLFYIDAHIGLNVAYGINFNKFKWNSLQGQVVSSIPSIKTDGFKLNVLFRFEINEQRFKDSKLFKRKMIRN